MSTATDKLQKIKFTDITPLTLAQCLDNQQTLPQPSYWQFTDDALVTNASISTDISKQAVPKQELYKIADSSLELVVFAELNLELLAKLCQQCQITIDALVAINHRNQQTSYRFNCHSNNLTDSRSSLVAFNLRHGIEAALVNDAPSLSKPGLLVMDMDSTAIKIECIDEIATLAGTGEQVAEVTELAMQGKLDFSQSLHQRVATLAGSSESILQQVIANLPLMEGLEQLISLLKKQQWRVAIASGGFTYFADHLKQHLGLDAAFANQLEITDGKLTGKVLGDVVDANTKAECLRQLAQDFNINNKQTVAIGDGANDLVMMAAACLGVAFHAKPVVLAQADTSINQQDLTCLLHWLK